MKKKVIVVIVIVISSFLSAFHVNYTELA
ncbi:MAG: hypothetical protein XD86_0218, partial [Mesotoga infera]